MARGLRLSLCNPCSDAPRNPDEPTGAGRRDSPAVRDSHYSQRVSGQAVGDQPVPFIWGVFLNLHINSVVESARQREERKTPARGPGF